MTEEKPDKDFESIRQDNPAPPYTSIVQWREQDPSKVKMQVQVLLEVLEDKMVQKFESRNKEIYRLKIEMGWSSQKIADHHNISRQRVFQILNELGYYRDGGTFEKRKKQIYEYIVRYKMKHCGCSPSGFEIRDGCSTIASWNQARSLINHLIEEGKLKKINNAIRTIEVVGGVWLPPHDHYEVNNGI